MNHKNNSWALVLAAGEGSRLHSLTTTESGLAVPKQFCSLHGGPSLLHEALERAAVVASPHRVCAVVAAQHRRWWQVPLQHLPEGNVISQPENRGTAHGILLPLLHIAARDPEATVLLLPADHHVRDEGELARSLRQATTLAAKEPQAIIMLGVTPEEPDTELGYIVPADDGRNGSARVLQFVEKPALKQARALLDRGALWNVFIIAATARALLALYKKRLADTVTAMRAAVEGNGDTRPDPAAVAVLYRRLALIDFSRDIIEGQEAALRVVPCRTAAGRISARRNGWPRPCAAYPGGCTCAAPCRRTRRISTSRCSTAACGSAEALRSCKEHSNESSDCAVDIVGRPPPLPLPLRAVSRAA